MTASHGLYHPPSPLEYFATLVADDASLSLLEAAASLAQDEHPALDTQAVLAQVDALSAALKRTIPVDAGHMVRLHALNRYFYQDLGFAGNVNDYYAPGNSHLSTVLQTRRGIPISLAVLYIELANELRLDARGISFPGHFLVKLHLSQGDVVMDPFTGQSLSREGLEGMLQPYLQQYGMADGAESPLGLFLQPATSREVLARMLRNLKEIYRQAGDGERLLQVMERLVILLPQDLSELRDRGLAHAEQGHDVAALRDLTSYLLRADDAQDAAALRLRVAALHQAGRRH